MKEINLINKISENLNKFPEIHNSFIKNFTTITDASKIFNSQIELLAKRIADSSNAYKSSIQKFGEQLSSVFSITNNVANKFSSAFEGLFKFYDELDNNIAIATKDGWYLSEDMIDYICGKDGLIYMKTTLKNWTKKSTRNEFTKRTITKVERRILKLEKNISLEFLNRKKIINKIFKLHKEGNYIASIPLALTQVDGMCKDIFSEIGFYDSEKKSKKYVQKISSKVLSDGKRILKTITEQLSFVDKDEFILLKYKNDKLTEFNRHNIMHGESVDYGNKINSIKAILLLDFMRGLKEVIDKK